MPSIRDFSGGVVNQELQNKDSGGGVLFDCKNVLSSWNGELRKRTGTRWLKSLESYSRILPYRMPDGNDIILLLENNTISAFESAGDKDIKPFYVYSGDAPSFPTSGWTSSKTNGDYTIDMPSTSSESITDQWKAFNYHTGRTYYNTGANWGLLYRSTSAMNGYVVIRSQSPQLFNSAVFRWTNSCNGTHTGHYKGWIEPTIQYSDDGITWTSVRTEISNPLPTGGAEYYQASDVHNSRTENYTVYKVSNVAHDVQHAYWRIYCAGRITNTQTYDGERLDLNISEIKYLSNTRNALVIDTSSSFQITESNVDSIKFAQNDNLMILTNGSDNPFYLQYSGGSMGSGTYVTTLESSQGKPACVCFYQNRLWFGGFSAFPVRVWGSAFGNFTDFTIPQTVLSTSPISADSVEIKSLIENMWAGNNALYCLSDDGISMIDAQGGVVATNQIEFKLRNREPANNMTPTSKDDIMIYLGRDKRKVLITDYDYVVQRFKAQNISNGYTDFLQSGIRELHYIPDQASLVYGSLTNGQWFVLLFDVDAGKNALFPLDTQGSIYDIQPIKYNSQTRLLLVVQRNGQFFLEEKSTINDQKRMDFMTETEKQDYTKSVIGLENTYLDCLVSKIYEEETDVINNIPFSPDSVVDVIADGSYIGKRVVVAGASVPLYAWKNNDVVLYTKDLTPTTSSIIYSLTQEELQDYTITAVAQNNISVSHNEETSVLYYGYNYINTISINPASGYQGIFIRDASQDGNITYQTSAGRSVTVYGCAWTQGEQVIYTLKSSPLVGERWIINGQALSASSTISETSVSDNAFIVDTVPVVGSVVYDSTDVQIGTVSQILDNITVGGVVYNGVLVNNKKYYRYAGIDTSKTVVVPVVKDYDRYSDGDYSSALSSIILDVPAKEVVLGYSYDSYAVLKFVSPYNMRKFPKEISVNFINTGYLELGNTFDSLKSVLNNLVESVSISNRPVLMNGNYTKTLAKQTFETPYVIVRSDKGLPFIITGLDYKVDMSNYQGGV